MNATNVAIPLCSFAETPGVGCGLRAAYQLGVYLIPESNKVVKAEVKLGVYVCELHKDSPKFDQVFQDTLVWQHVVNGFVRNNPGLPKELLPSREKSELVLYDLTPAQRAATGGRGVTHNDF